MARPLRIEYPGAFYHVIQRGNERKDIFKSVQDRKQFLEYIKIVAKRYNIQVHTFCLMNNHFHLILETKEANLTKAMHALNTSYTVYFNTKRRRSGHLFQGRYKAILVEADAYLHHLSRYIHLNPVRVKMVQYPGDYAWSSYRFFVSDIKPPEWLCTDFILSIFDNHRKKSKTLYKRFVIEHIGEETDVIRNSMTANFILGNQDFIEWIKEKFITNRTDREIPELERLRNRPYLGDIAAKIEKMVKDKRLSRKLAIYLSRKYTGKTLNEIANFYGKIRDTGVSQLCIRLEIERKKKRQLDILINQLEETLNV